MNLSVSNIAWAPEEDIEAYSILRDAGIRQLELAPTRFWSNLQNVSPAEVQARLGLLEASGFSIVAFQAILFGRTDLTVFETSAKREECLQYLGKLASLAQMTGAKALVFGAPKNRRVPASMLLAEEQRIAVDFFSALAELAAANGVYFTLEPNPEIYGCNFVMRLEQAVELVRRIGSPGLRLQIDAGELAANDEDPESAVRDHLPLIGHVHVSQVGLSDFESPWEGHRLLAAALRQSGYDGVVSLEMTRSKRGLDGLREAVRFFTECYGNS